MVVILPSNDLFLSCHAEEILVCLLKKGPMVCAVLEKGYKLNDRTYEQDL